MNSDFCDWVYKGGAKISKLEMVSVDGYRGMYAKSNIYKGDTIISIPLSLIITYEKALLSPINRKLKGLIDCEHTVFAIFLLEQRELSEKSEWFHYINMFPKDYKHMALFFDESLLDLLKGTLALEKISGRKLQ